MRKRTIIANAPSTIHVPGSDCTMRAGLTALGPASKAPEAPQDKCGQQMASFVARYHDAEEPLIIVGIVLGDQQMTLTLPPAQADRFCHDLADAILWQNDQLRRKAGQAVH